MGLRPARSEIKTRVSHGIAALVIGIEGFEHMEKHEAGSATIMLVVAVFLLGYVRFHPRLHHTAAARHFETAVFVGEALVMTAISLSFFHHGKHALPWLYAAVAVGYVLLALRQHRRGQRAVSHS